MPAHNISHKHESDWMDWIGVGLSGACLVHCLALPIFVSTLPFLGAATHNPLFHRVLAAFILPIALFAFWKGYSKHKNKFILLSGSSGASLVVIAILIDPDGHKSLWLTVLGSFTLLLSHLRNWWLLRCRECSAGTSQ